MRRGEGAAAPQRQGGRAASPDKRETDAPLVTGVSNPRRLRAVAEARLEGHLRDIALDAVVSSLHIATGAPIVVVNLVTPGLQTYVAEIGVGGTSSTVPDTLSFCAEVVDSGEPLIVSDATTHPVYADNPLVRAGSVGAYAGVPVVDEGVVLGSLAMFADVPRKFTEGELALLDYQARLVSSGLALRRMSSVDSLTGLPNRALLVDRLAWALLHLERNDRLVAVLFVDLDHFKEVNDRLGHAAGDEQLVAVAEALRQIVRPTDTVARLGGDEFVVVCEEMTSTGEVLAVADRILAAVDALPPAAHGLQIDASIGIAVSRSSSTDPDDLLRRADEAMYRAKQDPGARWILAAPTPDAASAGSVISPDRSEGSTAGRGCRMSAMSPQRVAWGRTGPFRLYAIRQRTAACPWFGDPPGRSGRGGKRPPARQGRETSTPAHRPHRRPHVAPRRLDAPPRPSRSARASRDLLGLGGRVWSWLALCCPSRHFVEAVRGGREPGRIEVPVAVQDERRAAVPGPLRQLQGTRSGRHPERYSGVAQVVDPEGVEAGSFHRRPEGSGRPYGPAYGAALGGAEHQRVGRLVLEVRGELVHDEAGKRHRSSSRRCLGWSGCLTAGDLDDLDHNFDGAAERVDVADGQADHLADA